jgi:NADH:ubiquinone oxidoreductase subunit E
MAQVETATQPPAKGAVSAADLFSQIQNIIDNNRDKAGALIRVLQQTQALIGYLPPVVLKTVARELKVPLSEVNGVVTFYHLFSMVPKGKYVIQVCKGTSCYVKGGQRIIETLKTDLGLEPGGITNDGRFSLEVVRCIGCCGLSPVIDINGNIHRKVKPTEIKNILNSYR